LFPSFLLLHLTRALRNAASPSPPRRFLITKTYRVRRAKPEEASSMYAHQGSMYSYQGSMYSYQGSMYSYQGSILLHPTSSRAELGRLAKAHRRVPGGRLADVRGSAARQHLNVFLVRSLPLRFPVVCAHVHAASPGTQQRGQPSPMGQSCSSSMSAIKSTIIKGDGSLVAGARAARSTTRR